RAPSRPIPSRAEPRFPRTPCGRRVPPFPTFPPCVRTCYANHGAIRASRICAILRGPRRKPPRACEKRSPIRGHGFSSVHSVMRWNAQGGSMEVASESAAVVDPGVAEVAPVDIDGIDGSNGSESAGGSEPFAEFLRVDSSADAHPETFLDA